MPKFLVPITRDCTETTIVDVEAPNAEAALAAALGEAEQQPEAFDWTHDDGSGGQADPYFAGGDDLGSIEREYAHTPDKCPSNHWNDGTDICADCGQDLQA